MQILKFKVFFLHFQVESVLDLAGFMANNFATFFEVITFNPFHSFCKLLISNNKPFIKNFTSKTESHNFKEI